MNDLSLPQASITRLPLLTLQQAHRIQRRIRPARYRQVRIRWTGRNSVDIPPRRSTMALLQQEPGQVVACRVCVQHWRDMTAGQGPALRDAV